jgi:hypothetical protein
MVKLLCKYSYGYNGFGGELIFEKCKVYDAIKDINNSNVYGVKRDDGWYKFDLGDDFIPKFNNYFYTLEEYRELKLKEILDGEVNL